MSKQYFSDNEDEDVLVEDVSPRKDPFQDYWWHFQGRSTTPVDADSRLTKEADACAMATD